MNLHYANSIPFINELEIELKNSWLEINLTNLKNNVKQIKKKLSKNTKFMAVVKADGYGHGCIEVAKKLQNDVEYFGVATIAEGKILRQSEIKNPILVLGSSFIEQIHVALKYDIDITIGSDENIQNIDNIAKYLGKRAKIHLKIDTGMGRIGIRPENIKAIINMIKDSENIDLVGLFTHYAEAENPLSNYTNKQLETFLNVIQTIKSEGFKDLIIHSANSSATLLYSESHFDMVRVGLGIYGYSNPIYPDLTPVMTLKSRIVSIKETPKNSYLGYNRSFKTSKNSLIGVVPIGYADGFPRVLSNKQDVLIKNQRCPIVGNISMDQCLVDLTKIKNVCVGDEVILLGGSKNNSIGASEWAEKSGLITYEILCGFGNRIPRIYID